MNNLTERIRDIFFLIHSVDHSDDNRPIKKYFNVDI